MKEEYQIKSTLLRTFFALVLCLTMLALKYMFKEEKMVEDICNYLLSDVVFLK